MIALLSTTGDVFSQYKELKVGDHIPANLTISHLYKGKPLIIDFWATWCVPCVYEMKMLDSLKTAHPNDFEVLMVTAQDTLTVQHFSKKGGGVDLEHTKLHFAIADTVLGKLFPHNTVPHNIWIDKNGLIKAITGIQEMKTKNILAFAKSGETSGMREKKDNLSFNGNLEFHLGDSTFSYRSIFTPYITGINGGSAAVFFNGKAQRFFQYNGSILHLYWNAYSDFNPHPRYNLIQLSTKDSLKFVYPEGKYRSLLNGSIYKDYTAWAEKNSFCYALTLPEKVGIDTFRTYMLQDLNRQFRHLDVAILPKNILCMVVSAKAGKVQGKASSGTAPLIKWLPGKKIAIKNANIADICDWLFRQFDENTLPDPFVIEINKYRETRFNAEIDLSEGFTASGGKMTPEIFFKAFAAFGFSFTKAIRKYPVLVIKDR